MAGPNKVPNLFDAWKQGDQPMPTAGQEGGRQRHKVGRQGTLEEVLGAAMRDPITKFGKDNKHYSSIAEALRNAVLSDNPEVLEAAKRQYASLSPTERETVDTLIVNAMPNPRGNIGLSEGAKEVLGTLTGSPLSPERLRALEELSQFEGFSWDRTRGNAPMSREAPPDRMPETTAGVTGKRPDGLSDSVVDEKETRPEFRGPQPEVSAAEGFRAPALDTDMRLKLGERFDKWREGKRQALFDLMQATTAGRGKRSVQGQRFPSNNDIAKRLGKIFPEYNPAYIREWADEWTMALNKNDINELNEAVKRRFPDLTPEQRDSEISRLWQEAHEIKNYGRQVSGDTNQWSVPYADKQRIEIARKQERGEPITAEERKILRQSVGAADANRSRMDVGEESDHQQFVRNLVEVLGYRPGFNPAEFNSGKGMGNVPPDRAPQNVATGIGRADSSTNAAEEFDPEVAIQEPLFDRKPKPKKQRTGTSATKAENMSRGAVDNLYGKLVIDTQGGRNTAIVRPPAYYGFKTPEEMARYVVDVANKGGEPVVPPTLIDSTVADLSRVFEQRWGADLGASSLEAKKATPDNAITERSSESRAGSLRDRLNASVAGRPLPPNGPGAAGASRPTPAGTGSLSDFDPEERNARLAEEAANAPDDYFDSSNPFLEDVATGGGKPPASPEVVRPTPTQVGAADGDVVTTGSPEIDEANRLLEESVDNGDEAPQAPPSNPQSIITPAMAKEIARMGGLIRNASGQQLQGAQNFYEKAIARRAEIAKNTPAALAEYDEKVIKPLEEAIAARREGGSGSATPSPSKPSAAPQSQSEADLVWQRAYDAATKSGSGPVVAKAKANFEKQKFIASRQAGAASTTSVDPSRPESLDPLEAASREEIDYELPPADEDVVLPDPTTGEIEAAPAPRTPSQRTPAEMAAADEARANIERGRAAGVVGDNISSGPLPESELDAAANREAMRRATIARRQEILRRQAEAVAGRRPASGAPGSPPESATAGADATATRAADSVDASKATKDAKSDEAVAVAKKAETEADAAAVAKRTEDAANTNAAPQTPIAGQSSSGSGDLIRRLAKGAAGGAGAVINAAANPGATALNVAGGAIKGGLGWTMRNLPGAVLVGGGALATRDMWMPYVPEEYQKPVGQAMDAASDFVKRTAGRAIDAASRIPNAQDAMPNPAVDPGQVVEPGVDSSMPPGFEVPAAIGGPGGGRPGMIEDPSVSRIRQMINARGPINPYQPQTPMRATTYYH